MDPDRNPCAITLLLTTLRHTCILARASKNLMSCVAPSTTVALPSTHAQMGVAGNTELDGPLLVLFYIFKMRLHASHAYSEKFHGACRSDVASVSIVMH